MAIDIEIKAKRAAAIGEPTIVCGNNDYVIQFIFDEEWNGLDVKTARFVYVQGGMVKKTDVVFTGDTVLVPVMANTREVLVGVFAGDLRTSSPARIPCEPSIRCGTGAPADPTPDVYDQIMALLNQGGGGGGGVSIQIDSELSETSRNPVENRVVTHKFNEMGTTIGNIDVLLKTV